MIGNHTERVYGAVILVLDRGIGRVMTALKSAGIDDNTLVIFTSDDGFRVGQPRSGPLSRCKIMERKK
jgi:arylsulfatase A-like enzyme